MITEFIHPETKEVIGVTEQTENKWISWLKNKGFIPQKKIVETSEEMMTEIALSLSPKQSQKLNEKLISLI